MKGLFKELKKFHQFSLPYLKPVKGKLFLSVVFRAISVALMAYTSILMRNVVDKGILSKNLPYFYKGIAVFSIVLVLTFLTDFLAGVIVIKLRNAVNYEIKLQIIERVFSLPMEELKKKGEGYFLSRIFNEATEIAHSIVGNISSILLNILWFTIGVSFAMKLSPILTITTLLYTPLHLIVDISFGKFLKRINRELKELQGQIYEQVSRILKFAFIVRIMGIAGFLREIYAEIFKGFFDKIFYQEKKRRVYYLIGNITGNFSEVIILFVAGILILKGKLTIGAYIGFTNLIWQVMRSSEALFSIIGNIYTVNSTIERFWELEDKAQKRCEKVKVSKDEKIRLKDVSFGYDERKIIKDFSLTINKGEKVLIKGANGSGKTTLCHLILGLLCPVKGEIETLEPEKFSYMPSDMPVFSGDIKNQITMGDKEREKRLEYFWKYLPVKENESGNLSQGEFQKVNILRTLVKDAEVYIFDEPFQHLDKESVEKMIRILNNELKDKTIIVVSHREDANEKLKIDKTIEIGGESYEGVESTNR